MGKATKKSQTQKSRDSDSDVSPSTSGTMPQKTKTCRKPRTSSKKDGGEFSFNFRSPHKVSKTIKKSKKTPPPQASNRKASEKTAKKTEKIRGKAMFGHYHQLMEELASTETEPEHSSVGSSTASTTDLESQ